MRRRFMGGGYQWLRPIAWTALFLAVAAIITSRIELKPSAYSLENTAHLKSIGASLRTYASHNNGWFPVASTKGSTANQAFRLLFPSDPQLDETTFHSRGLAGLWRGNSGSRDREPLSPGENSYSYFSGQSTNSAPAAPLATGFTLKPWRAITGVGWELQSSDLPLRGESLAIFRFKQRQDTGIVVLHVDGSLSRLSPDANGRLFLPDVNAGIATFALYPELPSRLERLRLAVTTSIQPNNLPSLTLGLLLLLALVARVFMRPRADLG